CMKIGIDDAHRHGWYEPEEGAGEEESAAEQSYFARRAFIVMSDVPLRHVAGVVAECDHNGPRNEIDPAKLSGDVHRLHLVGQSLDQPGYAANTRKRGDDENQAEGHEDGCLEEIGDHHSPESA